MQSRNKLQDKAGTMDQSEDGYSMNFDESMGQSQQLPPKSPSKKHKTVVEEVKEEVEEDDSQKPMSLQEIDEDVIEASGSIYTDSKTSK